MRTILEKASGLALTSTVLVGAFTLSFACDSSDAVPPPGECPTDQIVGTGGAGGGDPTTTTTGAGAMGPLPQEVAARLHGCRRPRYTAIGQILVERGVDLVTFGGSGQTCQTVPGSCPSGQTCYCPSPPCVPVGNNQAKFGICVASPATAGFLYQSAEDVFSVPKPDSRRGEKDGHTTASALRLMDLFIQAAPQIIANIEDPTLAPACVLDGATHPMFDPVDGSCVEESVSCLLGMPATPEHLLLCDLILDEANPNVPGDLEKKQHIAVAALLSAAHSCE